MSEPYRLPEEFETKRYLVRRIRPSDADAVFAGWSSDPEVTKYLIWAPHTDISQARDFAERGDRDWRDGVSFPAVISPLGAPRTLIGMVHPRPLARRVSYGWLIRRDHWGQGVASEVVAYAVDHALSHPAIFRAEATCDVDNIASARVMEKIASARVMEKAGMVREGLLRRHGMHPNVSDEPRDSFLYAKVR